MAFSNCCFGQFESEMVKMNVEIAQKSYDQGDKSFALKVLESTPGMEANSEVLSLITLLQFELKKYAAAKTTLEKYFDKSDLNSVSYLKMINLKKSIADLDKFSGSTNDDLIFQEKTKSSVESAVNNIMSSFKPICKSIIGSN